MRLAYIAGWLAIFCASACPSASWAASDRLFPKSPPPAPYIDMVDLGDASPELALMATTLQGVVNAGATTQLYLRHTDKDTFWLDWMTSKGWVPLVRKVPLSSLFSDHKDQIKRVYVYDQDLPASLNIATMLASLNRGVVGTVELAVRFLPDTPIENLSGRWTSNAEAYEWAFSELWPKLNHNVIACLRPDPGMSWLRDYLIQHKVFTFWVSGSGKNNENAEAHTREEALAEKVLAATPDNTPVMGFWFSGTDPGLGEYDGVGLAGEYGKITVVTDWTANLSLLAGVRVNLDEVAQRHHQRATAAPPPPFSPDKVYIGINVVESGDAPGYVQSRQLDIWNDPGRGSVPISWAMGLPVMELMPAIAAYYMEKATPNDLLYAAVSGPGYTHPYRKFVSRTADPNRSWNNYLALTNNMMERAHFTTLGLYTDSWKAFERTRMDSTTLRIARGIPTARFFLLGMGRDNGMTAVNGTYQLGDNGAIAAHILTRWPMDYSTKGTDEKNAWLVDEIRTQTPRLRPAFMQVMALSWAYGPSDIAEVLRQLGDTYVPVSIAQYQTLLKGQ